jgi:hypothetical protein
VQIKVPEKNSFEPDRRAMRGDAAAITKKAVDVASFVADLKTRLAGKPIPTPVSQPVAKPMEKDVKESEARALREENTELKRRIAELEKKPMPMPMPMPKSAINGEAVSLDMDMDMDAIYAEVKRRAQSDPGILAVIRSHPEIEVTIQRRTIQVDETKPQGMVAILISEGFFDTSAPGNAAFNELKRRGKSIAKPSVYQAADKLAEYGFLTKEGDGYKAVAGMKVNIVG